MQQRQRIRSISRPTGTGHIDWSGSFLQIRRDAGRFTRQTGGRSRRTLAFALVCLFTLQLMLPGCGRTSVDVPTPMPTETATDVESATPTPVASTAIESSSAEPSPSATGTAHPPENPPVWAADDFTVPAGSGVSREDWLLFLEKSLLDSFSAYSGAHAFLEPFGFTVEPSAGSGEWHVTCLVAMAWFTPGSGMMQFMSNRELTGVSLLALEREGGLSLVDLSSDFAGEEIPAAVEAALQASYRAWVDAWDDGSSTQVAALPTISTALERTPIGSLHSDFLPPAQDSATADLDGDGKDETIEVVYREDDTRWELRCGDAFISDWYEAPEGMYLVDLDRDDGRREIAVCDHGPSSDDTTTFYAYDDGAFRRIGSISGILPDGDGKGRLSTHARSWQGPLLTWFFRIEYALDASGRLAMMPTRWYASDLPVTVKVDLTTYAEPGTENAGPVLPAGTACTIDLSDISTWFRLTAQDGTQGWIRFIDGENLQLPGGGAILNQVDVLDGIVAAD